MASPSHLQRRFAGGTKRDHPRNQMPEGSLWWGSDLVPDLLSPARERGGWTNASDAITGVFAGADSTVGGIYAPFTAGAQNLAVALDTGVAAHLVKVAANGTCTDIGALTDRTETQLGFHRNLVIIPYYTGTSAPQKYNGTTIGTLGGSPPQARHVTVFKDRTCLGATNAQPQRLYFSDAGDPEGWDTTNTFWDFNNPITALAAVRNFILVFSDGSLSRLYGSTPPPGSDFSANDPLFEVGCTDARSVAIQGDRVLFANPEGIYMTDGSADPVNITSLCGMRTYWQTQLAGYTKSNWILAGGFLRDDYFIIVTDAGSLKVAARIDVGRRAWWPLTNVDARAIWKAEGTSDELYFGRYGAARVGSLSSIYSPAAANKADGDGDAVASVIETPFYEGDGSEKGWRKLYTTLELTDYASDNPTVAVSYIRTPEETSYTAITGSLVEGTTRVTKRLPLGFAADGVAFKLTRANAGDFLLYGLAAEVHGREKSRHAA
jgi:hypothetical protein